MNPAADTQQMEHFIARKPDTESMVSFKSSPEIQQLDLQFDLEKLREALSQVLSTLSCSSGGFHALPMTCRPGSDRCYTTPDSPPLPNENTKH